MSSPVETRIIFDGQLVKPPGRGPDFTATTFYIPIIRSGAAVEAVHVQGDGTAVATATLQHTNFLTNLDGTAIDPTVAGTASNWDTDADFGTLTIAASVTETGQDRQTFSNQPRGRSRLVLVVTTPGRIRGACSGVS